MAEHDPLSTHRRGFLKAGAAGSVAALAATKAPAAETQEKAHALPTRVLGRTGEKVTILNLGTFRGSGLEGSSATPTPRVSGASIRPTHTGRNRASPTGSTQTPRSGSRFSLSRRTTRRRRRI